MKIAVSSENNNGLTSPVAQHFGRCPYYTLVDIGENEHQSVSSIENPYYQSHEPGMVPTFIKDNQVDVMISGGMGGRAIQFFNQFGIEVATGAFGTVHDTIQAYLDNDLKGGSSCAESEAHGH